MTQKYWLVLLITMLLMSALAVIYVKHQSRTLFSELRHLQKKQDEAVIQWSRLQLQSSTLEAHSNIESQARKTLKMRLPETVYLVRLP